MHASDILLIANMAIIMVIFLGLIYSYADDRVYVTAFDGIAYKVRDTERKRETADALARINRRASQLIDRLLNDETNERLLEVILRLRSRYRQDALSEGVIDRRYTSYTVNKGEEIVLCLRSRDEHDRIYDENLLFYVFLHELAHVACVTDDHTAEFNAIFQYLLDQAERYDMLERSREKVHYCGVDVHGL